jgi:hypothetical protein
MYIKNNIKVLITKIKRYLAEIRPPWVKYPQFDPHNSFWSQPGKSWLHEVWIPYWKSLSLTNQEEYLAYWNAPISWKNYLKSKHIHEIRPPWIEFPGIIPGDFFWREAGEYWFHDVWRPYWESLSPVEKEEYLARWQVPEDWKIDRCINEEIRQFEDEIDQRLLEENNVE